MQLGQAVELFEKLRALNKDVASPEKALIEFCRSLGSVEPLHYDYKEKQNAAVPELDESDKTKLAKGVSGFSNSDGGVLIWGFEDKTLHPKPISNVDRFAELLLGLAASAVTPGVQGITAFTILSTTPNHGYAILLVPVSDLPPHQVILNNKEIKHRYYQRIGDGFHPMHHSHLEDMFGRRPKPKLELRFVRSTRNDTNHGYRGVFELSNIGRGSARNVCVYFDLSKVDVIALDEFSEKTEMKPLGEETVGIHSVITSIFKPHGNAAKWTAHFGQVIHPGMCLSFSGLVLWQYFGAKARMPIDIDYKIFCDDAIPQVGAVKVDPTNS